MEGRQSHHSGAGLPLYAGRANSPGGLRGRHPLHRHRPGPTGGTGQLPAQWRCPLHFRGGTQPLKMIMTPPFCPYGPALLEATRSKAEQASGRDTTIEVGMDPWDPSMMEEGVGAEWGLF